MVTYGGMSMQPVSIPTSLLIFKDITCRGFWLSGTWSEKQGLEGKAQALDRLVPYIQAGQLRTPRYCACGCVYPLRSSMQYMTTP
jgi:NADPH:quinone reductase-like Zn-dependent oxidoreductase